MEISIEEFKKVEMRVGKIEKAEMIPGAKNLMKLEVSFGDEKRQAVAGLIKYYKPEELVGNKYIFVTNLKPVRLMGIESNCMILAADDEKGKIALLKTDKEIEEGSFIR